MNLFRDKRKDSERRNTVHLDFEPPDEFPALTFSTSDLEKAIDKLPPGYKQVVILHDIEGYRHNEIAQLLDIKEGTSKSQLFHARKSLRMYLQEKQNFRQ